MKRFSRSLYLQVITAVIIGALVGHFYPATGAQMKPLGEGFIKLVKMLIAPIVFSTVVTGIAKMGDLRKVGRVGLKGIIYFEVLTTIALAIGLVVGKVLVPGAGMNVNPATLDTKAIASYTAPSAHLSTMDFIMNIIPKDVADAFARGEILQVLFFSILFGVALAGLKGDYAKVVLHFVDGLSAVLFKIVGIVMRVAPIGAFGAMAFTVGKYGVGTLLSLAKLIGTFYTTSVLFVVIMLGAVMLFCRLNIFKFLRYIKEEILIVLGTSSSESALPLMMRKMERLGCGKPVVGLVVPMRFVMARASDMNRSTPRRSVRPATGMLPTAESVAASVMKPPPVTAAAPFDVSRRTARISSSCPSVTCVLVAWAMKSVASVR